MVFDGSPRCSLLRPFRRARHAGPASGRPRLNPVPDMHVLFSRLIFRLDAVRMWMARHDDVYGPLVFNEDFPPGITGTICIRVGWLFDFIVVDATQ
jgi:hypothetical protein